MALSFFLILLPGLPVKNSLPVEQTHSANIISFSIYENENEPRLDDFLPLFVCFGTKIFSQHQTSTARFRAGWKNWATPALPRSRLRVSTSTPKPRAVSSNLTAPANPLVPRLCENRMAWGFFVPMLPWTGSSFSLPMPYMSPSCAISSHRLSKTQHQNRTPSFRFLRVSTTCGPLALSHAVRLSKNFPFLCLLHRNF